MKVDYKTLQERLNNLFRKDVKIITSKDIIKLYDGLTSSQKKLVDGKFRSFLLSKVKEERIEKLEKAEKKRIEEMGKEIEERKQYFRGHKICKSVQSIADTIKDPNSMFKDSEFIEKMTGCRIKSKTSKKNKLK